LGKSSILAAYFAHGLCTILASDAANLPEGLRLGREVVGAPHLSVVTDFESIAANGRAWYEPHSRAATAAIYADRLLTMHDPTAL
jgi:hypothetical protein